MAQMIWHPKPTKLQIVKIGELYSIYNENIHLIILSISSSNHWIQSPKTQFVRIRKTFLYRCSKTILLIVLSIWLKWSYICCANAYKTSESENRGIVPCIQSTQSANGSLHMASSANTTSKSENRENVPCIKQKHSEDCYLYLTSSADKTSKYQNREIFPCIQWTHSAIWLHKSDPHEVLAAAVSKTY